MAEPVHQRHKPPSPLLRPREMVVACAPLRSNVNLSRLVRTCGCCGVRRLVACGAARVVRKIARDSVDPKHADALRVEIHRTLPPVLVRLRAEGYRIVGLEQTSASQNLHHYKFERRCVLVVGNERQGLTEDVLALLDDAVEIPVYAHPLSFNVATAAAMALYEYCRQFPQG